MGVIFFVMNAAFALVLLILVLVSSIYALVSKNPDVRYQPMRDDRGSFIKSNSQTIHSTELDALGATARGDMKGRDLDDDRDSFSLHRHSTHDATQVPLPPSTANSGYTSSQYDLQRSPIETTVPFFPASSGEARQPAYSDQQQHPGLSLLTPGGQRAPSRGGGSPSPSQRSYDQQQQTQNYQQQQQQGQQKQQYQAYPQTGQQGQAQQGGWQVGAGYS